ncbi:MAG: hypothetical protein ABJA66_17010 [Actinomycetota bacterium]
MSKYEKVCTLIIRFVAVIFSIFGILGFITLGLILANINYSQKYTSWEAFHSGIFYLALGIILYLLSKPLAKLVCLKIED